jgi:hypothetical protein
MNLPRISLSIVLATAMVTVGCHSSNNQQADNQTPTDQTQQPAASGSGKAGSQPREPRERRPRTPPPPQVVELPAGTEIPVRLDDTLSSKDSQAGQSFSATVSDDVTANGTVVIPKGSRADGTVVDAKALGKFKGGALLAVQLSRVHTTWGSYPVETSSISKAEAGKGKRSAAFIGGGAGLGALIGGLAGGGKGAAIGALAGGGAGTAGSAFTGNKQIVLPAETLLTFRLQNPVRITESNNAPTDPQLQTR